MWLRLVKGGEGGGGRRTSRPTRKRNRTSPNGLSASSGPRLVGGKRFCMAAAETLPSTDGPSRMPAIISLTTSGWPANRDTAAKLREATRITVICRKNNFSSGIVVQYAVRFHHSTQARHGPTSAATAAAYPCRTYNTCNPTPQKAR